MTRQRVQSAVGPWFISTNTTRVGGIIDTAECELGIYFVLQVIIYNSGTFTLKIEHGDDSALADAEVVDSNMLIYGTLPAVTAAPIETGYLPKEGVHSTKRYVRASVVCTGVTGVNAIQVLAIRDSEVISTSQS